MHYSSKDISVPTSADSLDLYPQINYIQDLEFVVAKRFDQLEGVLTILRNVPTSSNYNSDIKWGNSYEDLQCVGKILNPLISPRRCTLYSNMMTVFVSPVVNSSGVYTDVSLTSITISATANTDITIKFSVKFLGFSSIINSGDTEYPFFSYGTSLKLLLNKVSSTQYNLLLVNGSSANTISTYTNFEALIGTWVTIVVSFSDFTGNTSYNAFYTNKFNFQVNNKLMPTNDAKWASLRITTFTTLTVPKEIIALWGKGLITFNYFNGFMGIYSSKVRSSGLKYSDLQRDTTTKADIVNLFTGSSSTNCLTNFDTTNLTFNCLDEYQDLIDETKYVCGLTFYNDDGTCQPANTNCPLGFFDKTTAGDNCSCSSVDKKLMIISKNSSSNVCKSKN